MSHPATPAASPLDPAPRTANPWLFVPTLYFMQSIPNVLVTETFGTAYKDLGVDNMTIALWTGLAALPWSFKMFWGPLVDLSFTKRQWTVAMQVLLTGAIAVAAGSMLTQGYFAISVAMMFLIAIFSATHDIACDGLYLMSLDKSRQAAFSGVMATCSRMGRLFTAAVIVYLGGLLTTWGNEKQTAWAIALGIGAAVYGGGMLWNFFSLPRPALDLPAADVQPGERQRNVFRTALVVVFGMCLYFTLSAAIEFTGYGIFRHLHGTAYDAAMSLDPAARPGALALLPPTSVPIRWHMTPAEFNHQLLLGGLCAAALIPIWLGVKRATHATPMANAFVSYIRQPGFLAILGFIVFYRFGEAMIFSMTKLFMLDPIDKGGLGVTVRDYSLINGFGQVGGLIVGGLLGGWFISRVGLRRAFWPLVFCMHTPNLLYVWLAYAQPANQMLLYPVVFVEAAGYGFGFAGYFVYLMHIAQRDKGPESPAGKFTTSHYAIGTGLGALFITFATISGGIIQSVFGYLGVFIGACIFTIPGTLILLVIPMDKTEGRGIKAEAE